MSLKFYLYTCVAGTLLSFLHPSKAAAQCNCSPGVPATPVVHTFSLAQTNLPSANISFPKFDPQIGDLRCVTLDYDISGISTTSARNYAGPTSSLPHSNPNYSPTGRLEYIFQLTVSATITGPEGISVIRPFNEIYGPDSLGAYGTVDDSITYGPDEIFKNDIGTRSTSSTADYLGTGNVDFSYSISGGLITLKGGVNFTQKIITDYSGDFSLTYYWCPSAPLSTKLFKTTLKNDAVLIQWQIENRSPGEVYEIQVSTDGKNFKTIHIAAGMDNSINGISQYLYSIGQTTSEKLYFRIKETAPEGRVSYSRINTISLKDITPYSNLGIYPNPIADKVTLKFDQEMDGKFNVDIINMMGQRVFNKVIEISRSNTAKITLNNPPSKGMYYLRATDRVSGEVYLNKVYVQ